jgi:two-component system phosphate regulon sensor histidine kinase PhoR
MAASDRHQKAPWDSPGSIAVAYVVVGLAWVAFSDRALVLFVQDAVRRAQIGTAKDSLFVAASGVVFFLLMFRSGERLRRASEELRATLDGLADGIVVVGPDGRIVDVNRGVLELTGLALREEHLVSVGEWARRTLLRHRDGRPVEPEQLSSLRVLHGERPGSYEAILRRPDGADVPVLVSAAPVLDRAGRPRLAVVVLRDLSESERLAQTREEFLATAAHELKTPLSIIKAHAQLLLRKAEEPGLAVIVRQVDRLTRLAQQILDASRLRLANVELRPERLDLRALAAVVVEDMGPSPGGHPVRIEGTAPAFVEADRDRITRVIAALVDNAIRFSPAESAVEVRVGVRGAEAIFSVLDHGVGISAERQDRVFERYYRAHSGTAEDRGGLGVGLDACREIVARHGGRMWFESERGVGSTFLFALPLAAPEGAP